MPEFFDSLDIAKRACVHVGCRTINSITENSVQNQEMTQVYGPLRTAELRRNVWTFACKKAMLRAIDETTMFLEPKAWDAGTTYLAGSIVKDTNGDLWVSYAPGNINNEPGATAAWDKYFGPLTVSLYNEDVTYSAGELVYAPAGNPGGYVVFVSLQNANSDDPEVATAWSSTVTYNADDTVTYSGSQYRSLIELNTGITPAEVPLAFDIGATYAAAQTVTGSNGYIYSSVGSGNTGHDPVTDNGTYWTNTNVPAAWTALPTLYPSSTKWLPLFAALSSQQFIYPLGCGPTQQSNTRNVFRLPAGYLRKAPQAPKQGVYQSLGAPVGRMSDDWEFDGKYIISSDLGPITFRFVADVTDVSSMDPMFCEGLAARIGFETCERITQSSAKKKAIAGSYDRFMSDAIAINAIEQGSEEPPEDDFITCRQ